jgi:hypothetical protein
MKSENTEFNASGDIGYLSLRNHSPCFAKLMAGRHIILKEGLTAEAQNRRQYMARATLMTRNHAGIQSRMAYSQLIRPSPERALDTPLAMPVS